MAYRPAISRRRALTPPTNPFAYFLNFIEAGLELGVGVDPARLGILRNSAEQRRHEFVTGGGRRHRGHALA